MIAMEETAPNMPEMHFSYNVGPAAVKDSPNRQNITKNISSADQNLKIRDRDKAVTRARSHQLDFSIAAWMVRKHLDFVAEHNLAIKTGDKSLDKEIESALFEQMKPENFDIRGQHSFQSYTRLIESHACIDGDIFVQRLRSMHIQGIEGDRVRDPEKKPKDQTWVNGVRLNAIGRPTAIQVHNRGESRNTLTPVAQIAYQNCFHHGFFQRMDQIRGISPLLSSMNDVQDVYENKAYGLAASKIRQMFGMALMRGTNDGETETPDPTKGVMVLELEREDDVKTISDNNPSNEWKEFMQMVIAMALKALDIPFSFYQENFTNFFGSKSAQILYLKSCVSKRRNLQENWLNPWVEWQLTGLRARPEFGILRRLEKIPFRWQALGTPSANPLQEIQAAAQRVALGVSSRSRETLDYSGADFADITDENSADQEYMTEKDVAIRFPAALPTDGPEVNE